MLRYTFIIHVFGFVKIDVNLNFHPYITSPNIFLINVSPMYIPLLSNHSKWSAFDIFDLQASTSLLFVNGISIVLCIIWLLQLRLIVYFFNDFIS